MVRSSGERTRDVKRRYARRGGSIPPRAEQQEKTPYFVTRTSPPLETVSPHRKEDTGQANSHTLAARKDEQNHFFGQPERRQIKKRFTNGLPPGQNGGTHGRHSRYREGAEYKSLFF
nr:MAG TPA: hypothetical protein [Caudoviricetes sp.]